MGIRNQGIAHTDAQMTEWLANNDQSKIGSAWGAGDIMYRDLNGDGVVDKGNSTATDHGDLKKNRKQILPLSFRIELRS